MKSILSPDMQAKVQLSRWKEGSALSADAEVFLLQLLLRMYSVRDHNHYSGPGEDAQEFQVSEDEVTQLGTHLADQPELLTTVKQFFALR